MTLTELGYRANSRGRQHATLVEGGLANGRTERSLVVLGTLAGCVVVEQGLTSERVFVPFLHADQVTVKPLGRKK